MRKISFLVLALLITVFIAACSPAGGRGAAPAGGEREPMATAGETTGSKAAGGKTAGGKTAGGKTAGGKTAIPDLGKEDNTRIIVATSNPENRFLETAAANFRKSHPGIIVEIKYYTAMGEVLTKKTENSSTLTISENTDPGGEKYIKTISTELMSGTGPDVIDTFYVPYGRYADNGFLCDMEPIFEQDAEFDRSGYYENILNAYKYEGGLFTMPLGFLTDFLAGIHSLPEAADPDGMTLNGFFESAGEMFKAQGMDGTYVLTERAEELFDVLFSSRYGNFVKEETRECDFTSGEFVTLIEQVKEAADKKLIFKSGEKTSSYKGWEDLFFLVRLSAESNYLAYYKNPKGQNNMYALPYIDGKPGVGAWVLMEYGINNNSKSKGAAWKFIKYLASEEMQTSPEFFWFPINKNAMAKKIERERVPNAGTELTAGDPVFSSMIVYPKANWQVLKIVKEETKKFFEGRRSAEDTAGIIQSRVNVMIKE